MNLATVKSNVRYFGVLRTFADVGLRAANRAMLLKVLKGIVIEQVDHSFLEPDPKYAGSFLSEARLREFAREPGTQLSDAFLDEALAKGDGCYGFLAGNVLAAYGWYSNKPTALDFDGLRLQFDDRYIYMYKGFTAPEHRGQRLHAIGMTRALQSYLERGYRGIVSYVEWNNFASLKSCYRMGYRDVGNILIAGARGRYVLRHDAACNEYSFRIVRSGNGNGRPRT